MHVAIDGVPAGTTVPLTSQLSEYRLVLPAEVQARVLAGPTVLSMTSDSFVPNDAGVNADSRRLGVVVDWIRIE